MVPSDLQGKPGIGLTGVPDHHVHFPWVPPVVLRQAPCLDGYRALDAVLRALLRGHGQRCR